MGFFSKLGDSLLGGASSLLGSGVSAVASAISNKSNRK